MPYQWDLIVTLPNITPPTPTPFNGEGMVLCSPEDEPARNLENNPGNETARRMLSNFQTAQGRPYAPGCLLIRTDAPQAMRHADAIRAFRNVCAIATITHSKALHLASFQRAQWTVAWSDQFRFGFHTPGRDGWVQTLDGASRGMDDEIPLSQPDPQFANPGNWAVRIDRPLLRRLLVCWQRYYIRRTQRRVFRRLFRALEVAFHASLFPADGLGSINDLGTRLALWISAFEVLCHPGQRNVSKRDVQDMLRAAPFDSRALTAARFTISHLKQRQRVTLSEALYDDLYWARNQFLHGMPVSVGALYYRQSSAYTPLVDIAPVLFSAALLSYLDRQGLPWGPMRALPLNRRGRGLQEYFESHIGLREIQEGLEAAAYKRDEFGEPVISPHRRQP